MDILRVSVYDGTQLCAQVDSELFFPEDRKEWKSNIAQAKTICAQCPMFKACDVYAKSFPGLYGVWACKWYDGAGFVSQAPYVTTNRKVA